MIFNLKKKILQFNFSITNIIICLIYIINIQKNYSYGLNNKLIYTYENVN